MTRRFISALLCLFLTSGVYSAYSQDYVAPPVTISKEKVRIEGRQYYSHIVLEKQTLFSIGKAYGVTVEDIYAANPGLKETGLKKNAVILIPDRSSDKPANEGKKKRKGGDDDGQYIVHVVRWYEDLDVISEKYGIPVEVIMDVNNLKGRKLKNRQKLRIPADSSKYTETAEDMQQEPARAAQDTTLAIEARPARTGMTPAIIPFSRNHSVSLSLLLPLNAKDSTAGSRNNMDFYCGALLAAKELGESGINIDLSVYDISGRIESIPAEKLRKNDVVIGPVSYADLSRVMATVPKDLCVVSPLDHRAEQLAASYRNFIQAPAPYSSQYTALAGWVKDEMSPHDSILVIHEKGTKDRSGLNILTGSLDDKEVAYKQFSYSILEGRDILDTLQCMMTLTGRNHLLIASDSEAFVNDVVRNINLMIHDKYDVSLYASSKIRGFETIEAENLHNANLHVATSYYIDYDRKEVQNFILQYRALFNTEPSPFAFQGYDITKYFICISSKYGNAWPAVLQFEEEEMLQSGFRFSRVAVGGSEVGYINTAIRRIIYGPDYSITLSEGL